MKVDLLFLMDYNQSDLIYMVKIPQEIQTMFFI